VFCATVLGGVPLLFALPGERYVHAHGFLATRYDPFMPITIVVTILIDVVVAVVAAPAEAHAMYGLAAILMVCVIAVSLTKNVPINHWVTAQDPTDLPADWVDRRVRWRMWNLVRTVLCGTALVVNLAAAMVLVLHASR
jgi:uncharacterized membrane protein